MGCGDSSGCDVVVVVVFVALPVVAGVADAAGMAILDVIGKDDNDVVVVANTAVVVIATVSTRTAAR